jgi:Flp pilus assembly protein TadG
MMRSPNLPARHPATGSVTILVAVLWTALFGMAAMAIDVGHMYLSRRNLQEVADAAVMAGLPSLSASATTARSRASAMAQQNGYTSSNVTTTTGTAGGLSTLTVTITASEPFFLAKAFGYTAKTLSATAIGQVSSPTPAIFAGAGSCSGPPTPTGLQLNGGPTNVIGDIESNGFLNNYGSGTITGSAIYGSGAGCTSNISGATNSGGSIAFPYSYTTASFGTCTFGSLTTAGDLNLGTVGPFWDTGGPSGGTLVSGVYCANGNINASASNMTGRVTFVATGQVIISSSTAHLTAFSNGVLAYSTATGNCHSNQAIIVGNSNVSLSGSLIAPNGCIEASGTTISILGSVAGNEVSFSSSGTTIDSTSSGGANYWIYQ